MGFTNQLSRQQQEYKNTRKPAINQKIWLFHECPLILQRIMHQLERSLWNYEVMLSRKRQKTSELSVHTKKGWASKDLHSTELFQTLCAKEETSQTIMALEESPSTETSLRMRTFN